MKTGHLLKASIWLMVIGAVALVTPKPAWPAWAAWVALIGGAILIPVGMVYRGRHAPQEKGSRAARKGS